MIANKATGFSELSMARNSAPICPPKRILLVDDDALIRQVAVQTLTRNGYRVDAFEDGRFGWKALRTRRYDLLITDNTMPYMTGLELIERVRSAKMTLPVILASGTLSPEAIDRIQWSQLFRLSKPFDNEQLLDTVRTCLSAVAASTSLFGNRVPSAIDDFCVAGSAIG